MYRTAHMKKKGSSLCRQSRAQGKAQRGGMIIRTEPGKCFFHALLVGGSYGKQRQGETPNAFCNTLESGNAGRWTGYKICGEEVRGHTTGSEKVAPAERATDVSEKLSSLGRGLELSGALAGYRRRAGVQIQLILIYRNGNDRSLPRIESCGAKVIEGCGWDHSQAPGRLSRYVCIAVSFRLPTSLAYFCLPRFEIREYEATPFKSSAIFFHSPLRWASASETCF